VTDLHRRFTVALRAADIRGRIVRHRIILGGLSLLGVSCLLQPRFVAIDPEYGYVDGCTDVVLQGAKLGTEATVTIGGRDLLELAPAEEDPTLPEHAQDVGYKYFGLTPPAPEGASGFQDVVMTVDGEALTLPKGFYYMACPATFHVETLTLGDEVEAGATFEAHGCGLDPEAITGILYELDGATVAATFDLALTCSTARASMTFPDVAPGQYWLELAHDDGTTYGGACVPEADTDAPDTDGADTDDSDAPDTDSDAPDTDSATPDSAQDTADPCAGTVLVTVVAGGA
jgi:hypothetical protein